MGPAESVQDADKLFMPAMVEGDVSNVAVIKSSNKQVSDEQKDEF